MTEDWDFHKETFICRLSHPAHIRDIKIPLFRLLVKKINRAFKDNHSSNVNNVLCGLRINTKNFALHKYYFDILYWHVHCPDLNTIEEVWNITKRRCESLPSNKFSPLSPSVRRK